MSLAPITFLIGANASGKSNALEAIRLLSWLAKGSRLDDIERNIQSGNAIARGQAIDLFGAEKQYFTLGTHIDKYLSKINYTYLTPSCLLPLAFCLSSLGN